MKLVVKTSIGTVESPEWEEGFGYRRALNEKVLEVLEIMCHKRRFCFKVEEWGVLLDRKTLLSIEVV